MINGGVLRRFLGPFLVVAVVLPGLTFTTNEKAAAQYSSNCPSSESIPEGDYQGKFSWEASGAGVITIDVEMNGTLDLTINEEGDVSAATADVKVGISGAGPSGIDIGGQGGGTLKLTEGSRRSFSVSGTLTGSGSFGSSLKEFSGTGSDEVTLNFGLKESTCAGAKGLVLSKFFTETLAGFKAAGLASSSSGQDWQVTRSGEAAKRFAEMQKKVDELVKQGVSGNCGGLNCGRVLQGKFQKLLDEAKNASRAERNCLTQIVFDGIRAVYSKLTSDGVKELNDAAKRLRDTLKAGRAVNIQHEFTVLKERLQVLLRYSKQLALIGVENCTLDFTSEVFSAYGSVGAMLIRAGERQREPVLLLEITEGLALVGAAKSSTEGALDEILGMSLAGAKESYKLVRKYSKPDPCRDEALTAWKQFQFWVGQAKALRNTDWEADLKALEPKFAGCPS